MVSQENQYNLNQNIEKENNSNNQAAGKLVGEINPDNFTFESNNFIPKVKSEIKHENSEKSPLIVTNAQSLIESNSSKVKMLPLREAKNNAKNFVEENDSSETNLECAEEIQRNSEKVPSRLGHLQYGCPFCSKIMGNPSHMKLHILAYSNSHWRKTICL